MAILSYKNNAVSLGLPKIGDRGLHLRIAADNCAELLVRAECHAAPQLWCSTPRRIRRAVVPQRQVGGTSASGDASASGGASASDRASPKGGARALPVEVENNGDDGGGDRGRKTLTCSGTVGIERPRSRARCFPALENV